MYRGGEGGFSAWCQHYRLTQVTSAAQSQSRQRVCHERPEQGPGKLIVWFALYTVSGKKQPIDIVQQKRQT